MYLILRGFEAGNFVETLPDKIDCFFVSDNSDFYKDYIEVTDETKLQFERLAQHLKITNYVVDQMSRYLLKGINYDTAHELTMKKFQDEIAKKGMDLVNEYKPDTTI